MITNQNISVSLPKKLIDLLDKLRHETNAQHGTNHSRSSFYAVLLSDKADELEQMLNKANA